MNLGHSSAWDQEWEKAAEYYRAAVSQFPGDTRALTSLGLALFELQDYERALKAYQQALKTAPQDPALQEKIGRIYERLGRLSDATGAAAQAAELHLKNHSVEKAIENWQRVLSITPENIPVRMRLATVYERLNRKEDAVAEYVSAASLFQRAGQPANALKAIEMADKVLPNGNDVRMALQMVRAGRQLPRPNRPRGGTGPVRMANVRGMDDSTERAGSGDPVQEARQKALIQLAGLLFDEAEEVNAPVGRPRSLNALARGLAERAGGTVDHTRIMLHIGQAVDSLTQNNEQQAAVELEHATGLGLHHPAATYLLGTISSQRAPEKALKYLQQSIKHPDYMLASHLLIGSIQEAGQHWNDAVSGYLMALAAADTQMVAAEQRERMMASYDALIDAQTSLQNPGTQQAICQTIRATLLRPDWRVYLAQVRQQLAEPDDAEPTPLAETLLETSGSQVIDAMARIRKLASQGHTRTALEEALFALQEAPSYLPLHVLVADLLLQDQHTAEAVAKYLVVAELYGIRGEVARAARILRQVSQLLPTDFGVRQQLIELFISQDAIEEALEEQIRLGELFYQLTDLDKARQTYLDAFQTSKRSKNSRTWGVTLLLKVADLDMQRLNLRQALRIYEQIRVVQPDDLETQAQIVLLNLRLRDDKTAIKELDEILQYLEGKGKHTEAVQLMEKLLAEDAEKIELHWRLAQQYVRTRQTARAVSHLDAVAEQMMHNQRPAEALQLIEMIISLKPANVADYQAALVEIRKASSLPVRIS